MLFRSKNVVAPSAIIGTFGADTARLFMLSDSPPERDLEWSEAGVEGAWRYLGRLYRLVTEPSQPLPPASRQPSVRSFASLPLVVLALPQMCVSYYAQRHLLITYQQDINIDHIFVMWRNSCRLFSRMHRTRMRTPTLITDVVLDARGASIRDASISHHHRCELLRCTHDRLPHDDACRRMHALRPCDRADVHRMRTLRMRGVRAAARRRGDALTHTAERDYSRPRQSCQKWMIAGSSEMKMTVPDRKSTRLNSSH